MRRMLALAALGAALVAGCTPAQSDDASPGGQASAAATAHPTVTPKPATAEQSPLPAQGTPFYDAGSSADDAAQRVRADGREADAALIDTIAAQPMATWLGSWIPDPTGAVETITAAAAERGEIALFVVYNIPGRDCGLYSAGGLPEDQYLDWVSDVAAGITPGSQAWFILEPDALPMLGDCEGQGDRVHLLSEAARILDEAGGAVFLDAGNSNWRPPDTMVDRIGLVGTEHLTGFSTNVSNYNATADERAWATQVASQTGLVFLVDTSRNGNGSNGEWCNPRGRALGEAPAVLAASDGLLATVWAKAPGESDGTCNGGPAAGQWWEEIALELAGNA